MKPGLLIENTGGKVLCNSEDVDITSLTIDSRKAKEGSLFICIKGFTTDGHTYIQKAYEQGCRAFIIERDIDILPENAYVVRVDDSRAALNHIAKAFYNDPSSKLKMIGITGTNGKTSTSYFMEAILKQAGIKTGVIGTIEIRVNGKKKDIPFATSTTPDTIELNAILDIMKDEASHVVMEVSSHSLELKKVDSIAFDTAIFTNLTQDHLDFHKTMENYCAAKAKLFKMCKKAVINADDPWSDKITEGSKAQITTFSIDKPSDFKAENIQYLMDRVLFTVNIDGKDIPFDLDIPGRFSVYNALGVIAAAYNMGIDIPTIQKGIASIKGVPGRIQEIPNNKGFNVFVDYAHTPDGLENVISAVREFTKGRIITVFGCGGDRDKKKRPIMGDISAKLSDITIITSDNPRTEDPDAILNDIEPAVKAITENYERYVDRKEAIYRAIALAKEGDSVIIAGKGHENYEIFKDKTIHFDDSEVAAQALGGA